MKLFNDDAEKNGASHRRTLPTETITCSICGAEDYIVASKVAMSKATIESKFRAKGWHCAEGGTAICPKCLSEKKTALDAPADPVAAATSVRSPAALHALPILYSTLGEAYDPIARNYRHGWSDERVSKETKLSIEFVRSRRESDFGPVQADTSVEDFADMQREIVNEIRSLQGGLRAIRQRIQDNMSDFDNAQTRLVTVLEIFRKQAALADKLEIRLKD